MATFETNGDGSPTNPSGVYRHPDTGGELVFQATSKFGNPGADAAVRLGYVYAGAANKEKVAPVTDPSAAPIADTSPAQSIAQLETELAATRGRLAAAEKAAAKGGGLVDPKAQKAKDEAVAAAKEAAEAEKGAK
jgi:hypothetical protein